MLLIGNNEARRSPHSSDEEVENSDHGDADQDVQGPLDHGAVHVQAVEQTSGTPPAAVCGVPPAAVGGGGSGRRGAAGGGFGRILRHGHEHPAERNQNHRQNSVKAHLNICQHED